MKLSVLDKKELFTSLYPQYTDEQISIQFNITIAEVRQLLKGPIPLNEAAWQEILAMYYDEPDHALAKIYNTSRHQIKKWTKGVKRIKLGEVEQQEAILNSTSLVKASKLTGIPKCRIKEVIPRKAMPNIDAVKSMSGTHEEIAKALGVSRSWVTKVVSEKHKQSTPNKIKNWDEVLKYLEANSLTATAKHFNVSPSTICHWRKRNDK